MRKYEVVCIFHPDMEEDAFTSAVDKVRGWITDSGGSIDKTDIWGRRKMAYAIRKQREGQYVLMVASMDPASIVDLDHNLRFLEPLLRHMITALE